jgi:hypothetical protein
MKNIVLALVILAMPLAASAGCIGPVVNGKCEGTVTQFKTDGGGVQQPLRRSESLRPNVYGPGIHQNRYGQPVTLEPQGGGSPGEMLQIKPDAYGLGIHMDQYGRPVKEKPWP